MQCVRIIPSHCVNKEWIEILTDATSVACIIYHNIADVFGNTLSEFLNVVHHIGKLSIKENAIDDESERFQLLSYVFGIFSSVFQSLSWVVICCVPKDESKTL